MAHATTASPIRILIADPIAQEGVGLLRLRLPESQIDELHGLSPARLSELIGGYTALIVRSATQVTADLLAKAARLQVVGRAGVGLDNIDVEAAEGLGVRIVNSPTGNVVAAAEHTIALLMALARLIPAAHGSMQAGRWEKSRFLGVEVRGKVLGIIGLGRVGREVAQRARGLSMQVIASDPYVSHENASALGILMVSMEELLLQADFVTLHVQLPGRPPGRQRLLGAREFGLLKPGARLINCARGGLIDEEALLHALAEQRLAGVALDVFSHEPVGDDPILRQLLADERVIATPHLGGSTREAQIQVSLEVAEQVASALHELSLCPV
jgi:D-3-phosphoglycerate dehydrogenase